MKAGHDILEQDGAAAFRAMADAAPTPVWMTAASGGIVFVNQAFSDLTGLTHRQLRGDACASLMHPDDAPAVTEQRAAAWRDGHAPYEFVARFKDAAGAWRWMHATARPRFGERGEFQGYVGMAVDESAARRALSDLHESESRLRLVQEAASIGSVDWDMSTGAIYRSPEYLKLHGLPPDQPLSVQYDESWKDRLHPEDRDAVIALVREQLTKTGAFEVEYRIIRADTGATRWILSRGRIEAGPDRKPARLLAALSDITSHKNTEFELRARVSEAGHAARGAATASHEVSEQFRLLVQGVVDYALYLIDPLGRVTTWNAGAARIKGYAADEIVGRHFSVFYPLEDREAGEPARALEVARRTGRFESEGWRVRKDGSRFLASAILDAIADDDGRLIGFAKITRDITEQRRAQRELEHTREALVQSQKMEMVGQLTGGLAHDFNNMLAGIIGALNLMQRRISAGRHEDVDKYVETALASAHRAASLTSRLLAFGRRQSLDIKPVDVAAAVRSMEILLERSIGENIRLTMNLGPAVAMTDVNQFEAAILNLVVNARDAMPDGGELAIETATAADGFVTVVVRDTGQGMAPDVLEKAFEPFFTTKPIGQGTGLGLSTVHGFVNQSGGSIGIASVTGEGATVTMRLPAAEHGPPKVERCARHVAQGAGETVLVVEDDPQVRMLVLDVLSELGYRTLEAGDAPQALAQLESEKIDLLISDVGLPGLNGRQLAEIARSRAPKLRVLFMTGYAEHARVRSLDAGMDLIAKPFDIDLLAAKIEAMMAR